MRQGNGHRLSGLFANLRKLKSQAARSAWFMAEVVLFFHDLLDLRLARSGLLKVSCDR